MIKSLEKLYNNDTIQQTNNGQHCNNKCNHWARENWEKNGCRKECRKTRKDQGKNKTLWDVSCQQYCMGLKHVGKYQKVRCKQ